MSMATLIITTYNDDGQNGKYPGQGHFSAFSLWWTLWGRQITMNLLGNLR